MKARTLTMKSSLKILAGQVGDVAVLKLSGSLIPGEPCVIFRDYIRQLVDDGQKKIVLDLADIRHVESSGIGELVSASTLVSRAGGSLKLVRLTRKFHELLQITKLFTVFQVLDSEPEALKAFEAPPFYCCCPICKRHSQPPIPDVPVASPGQACDCGVEFEISFSQASPQRAVVRSLRLDLYEENRNEYLQILSGPPFTLQIVGSLNFFGSSALKKAWQAIPSPRRVLIDLRQVTAISAAGFEALLRIVKNGDDGARAAISAEGLSQEHLKRVPIEAPVYATRAEAVAALGDVSDTPAWATEVVRM